MRQLSTYLCKIYAKIYKKLVCSQLRSFMEENNIIMNDQSGFRQYHSTETILLDSTNEWHERSTVPGSKKGIRHG